MDSVNTHLSLDPTPGYAVAPGTCSAAKGLSSVPQFRAAFGCRVLLTILPVTSPGPCLACLTLTLLRRTGQLYYTRCPSLGLSDISLGLDSDYALLGRNISEVILVLISTYQRVGSFDPPIVNGRI